MVFVIQLSQVRALETRFGLENYYSIRMVILLVLEPNLILKFNSTFITRSPFVFVFQLN